MSNPVSVTSQAYLNRTCSSVAWFDVTGHRRGAVVSAGAAPRRKGRSKASCVQHRRYPSRGGLSQPAPLRLGGDAASVTRPVPASSPFFTGAFFSSPRQLLPICNGMEPSRWRRWAHGLSSPRRLTTGSPYGAFCLPILAAFALVSSTLHGAQGYLARLGPVPIRFAQPLPKFDTFAWLPRLVQTAATNSTPATKPDQAVELHDPAPPVAAAMPDSAPPAEGPPPAPPLNSGHAGLSAGELLVVTPQMLEDYLRPSHAPLDRTATNGLPYIDVPFMPPAPMVPPSSEAIYRSQ